MGNRKPSSAEAPRNGEAGAGEEGSGEAAGSESQDSEEYKDIRV